MNGGYLPIFTPGEYDAYCPDHVDESKIPTASINDEFGNVVRNGPNDTVFIKYENGVVASTKIFQVRRICLKSYPVTVKTIEQESKK